MSFIDTIKLGRLNQVYDVLYERNNGIQTVSSLTNLPTTKSVVLANLNASSAISLAGSLKVGEEMQVICNPTADFALEVGDAIEKNFEGQILATNGQKFGLNIVCYDTGKYFLTADVAIGAIKVVYEYTFNVTPTVADTVIMVGDKKINGNKAFVEKNAQVNYTVSAPGYRTVSGTIHATPESNKTISVTLEKLPTYKKPAELQAGDIYLKNGGFKDKSEIPNITATDISGVVLCAPYSVLSNEMAPDPANFNLSSTGKGRMYIDILKASRNDYKNEFTGPHLIHGNIGGGVYAVKHFGYYSDYRTQHSNEKIPSELLQPINLDTSNNTVSIRSRIFYKCPKYFNLNLLHLHEAYEASYDYQTDKYNYEYYVDNITAHYASSTFNAVNNGIAQDVAEFYTSNNINPPIPNNVSMWDLIDPRFSFIAYTCPTLFTLKKFTESDSNIVAVIDSFAEIMNSDSGSIRAMINNATIHVSDIHYPYITNIATSPFIKCKHSDALSRVYYRTNTGVIFPPVYEVGMEMGVTNLLNMNIPIENKLKLGTEFQLFPVCQFYYEL